MEANNMAAMREALELAIEVGDWCCSQTDDPLECCEFSCVYQVEPHGEAGADCPWKKIRAALALPLRNCDVGTAEEQTERQARFCAAHRWCGTNCPAWEEGQAHNGCVLVWGQMPYEAKRKGDK